MRRQRVIAMILLRYLILLAAVVAPFAGCNRDSAIDSQQITTARSNFVLAEEPTGVEGVLDVQESYQQPRTTVMVGRIGGVEHTWASGKASFVLSDPTVFQTVDNSKHDCQEGSCKFCAREAASKLTEGRALIRFLGADGGVVPIDARKLFDIREQQTVVVKGRVEVNPLGLLVVSADGIYVRR